MFDKENKPRAGLFSDGFVWAFEPGVHILKPYLLPIREWFQIVYPYAKEKMCSRNFSLLVDPKMDEFSLNCLKTNRVIPWGEL